MSNIAKAFAGGKAFIPFITCGDPDLDTTEQAVRAMARAGADLIELGIPFSDPTAEGPVIQAANQRALSSGVTTDKIFGMVRRLRRDVEIPLIFMTYANVVFSYGTERFCAACEEIGIDGLILPDVPYEEKGEFEPVCRRHGLDLISMIAPTSQARIAAIARDAAGFLYVVSSLASPACGAPSPRTSARWSGRSVTIHRSPAPWDSASPPQSRPHTWPPSRTGPSWAAPLSNLWNSMGQMPSPMWQTMSAP